MSIVTFYQDNINPDMVKYQKAVFDYFGINITQVLTDKPHGEAIDNYLHASTDDKFIIFDIDCIPLNKDVIDIALKGISDGQTVYGAIQHANHIPKSDFYCSPAFCCFSRIIWEKAGRPTFKDSEQHDVGSFFSSKCSEVGFLDLLWPTHVQVPKWNLGAGSTFGHGTTYDNQVYHAFESRMNNESTGMFITKCKEVLSE